MTKTIPLISASLKSFMRNWKFVFMLVIFPLLLIGFVFSSFSPTGLQDTPIGIVNPNGQLDLSEFDQYIKPAFDVKDYNTKSACLQDLRIYKRYACVEIFPGDTVIMNIHFDNTREPVIWEVIQNIGRIADIYEQQKSKEVAEDVVGEFGEQADILASVNKRLEHVQSEIERVSDVTLKNAADVKDNAGFLSSTYTQLNTVGDNVNTQIGNLDREIIFTKDEMKRSIELARARTLAISSPQVRDEIRGHIDQIDSDLNQLVINKDQPVNSIGSDANQIKSSQISGGTYINLIVDDTGDIQSFATQFDTQQESLQDVSTDISAVIRNLEGKSGVIDADSISNPVIVRNERTYTPSNLGGTKPSLGISDLTKLSQQTNFPIVLIIILMFLSILVSSFITLTEINSLANRRIKLVRHIFIQEFWSVYLASLLIMVLPIICILLFGQIVYKLPIISHLFGVLLILFLMSSAFILAGIAIAYMVKKESITLLIHPFLLFFLIFFSGFLLPIERMATIARFLASIMPSKIGLSLFNTLVFYNQPMFKLIPGILLLIGWIIFLTIIALLSKVIRKA